MIITLLGMTGTGKTLWAKRLEQQGFLRVTVDDVIEAKLGKQVAALGYHGTERVSKWLGRPTDPRYAKNSHTYIELERDAILEILALAHQRSLADENTVIDTSGSLVYAPDDILRELSQLTTMVYFSTSPSAYEELIRRYLADPKPVIWGITFDQRPGETYHQALARCYPRLLKDRSARYEALAQVTISFDKLQDKDMAAQHIIDLVASLHRG